MFAESSREAGVGLLWVELLRFYSLDFQLQDRVLSVRTSSPLWRDIKDWPRKRIAIEGQFTLSLSTALPLPEPFENAPAVHNRVHSSR